MTSHATDMPLSLVQPIEPPVGAETDELLLGQLRQGDARAGEKLVLRYHEPLSRYLRRLTGQVQAAEDLQQQTWLSVLEHIEKFDPSSAVGGFKAWLFRIATNKTNDLWRAKGRERAAHVELQQTAESIVPDAGHRIQGMEDEAALRDAISRLPEAQRQVLLLRYYSGLKFVEIAEILGCPLNTALGRMHKAMLKLKELMERSVVQTEETTPEGAARRGK